MTILTPLSHVRSLSCGELSIEVFQNYDLLRMIDRAAPYYNFVLPDKGALGLKVEVWHPLCITL